MNSLYKSVLQVGFRVLGLGLRGRGYFALEGLLQMDFSGCFFSKALLGCIV